MKKIIISTAAFCMFSITVHAQEFEISKPIVEYKGQSATVECSVSMKDYNEDETMTLRVFKPGIPENMSFSAENIETVDSAPEAECIDFIFNINKSTITGGKYTVYVTAGDGTVKTEYFYYATPTERENELERFFEENADIESLLKDEKFVNSLALSNELFDALNKKGVAEQLEKMLREGLIQENLDSFKSAINKANIYEACNQDKTDLLFDENWKYDNYIKISDADKNGITVYKYFSGMSKSEKAEVQSQMKNYEINSDEELYRAFAKAVVLSSVIKNTNGWGFLREMLESNGEYVELKLNDYSKLSDSQKNKADAYILQNKSSVKSVETLQKVIDNAVIKAKEKNLDSDGGGSSGGGGWSNSGNGATALAGNKISATQTEQLNQSFSDMAGAEWAKEYVETLAGKGIINGYEDNTFKPNNYVKREEFVKLLVMAWNIKHEYADVFKDVDAGAWYSEFVGGAYKAGIIMGNDNGEFGIGKNITRQDAAVMLYRIVKTENAKNVSFNDEADIADYAIDAVKAMASAGIINGRGNNSFVPEGLLTRAEAAALICRTLDEID